MAKQIHDQLEDMLPFIFLKLPFKFLLPLRYVSRSWNALISDPKFEEWHLEVGQKPTNKILLSTKEDVKSFDYEASSFDDYSAFTTLNLGFHSPGTNLILLGSCNGLIFCSLEPLKHFFIWNPYTGHYKALPDPYIPKDGRRTPIGGFGYDACTDDYKAVVATLYQKQNKRIFLCVLSLRKDCWKFKEYASDFQESEECEFSAKHQKGLFLNGRLYWLKCNVVVIDDFYYPNVSEGGSYMLGKEMIVFDLVEDRLYVDQFSETMDCMKELGVLGWYLCVAIREIDICELWFLKDTWTLEFQIETYDQNFLEPLCITNSGQIIFVMDESDFLRYDPVEDTSKVLRMSYARYDPEATFKFFRMFYADITDSLVYLETPISPNTLYKKNNKDFTINQNDRELE